MSHGIRAYQQASLHSYGSVPSQQPTDPTRQTKAPEQPATADHAPSTQQTQAASRDVAGLNQDEHRMIQRYFPEKPELSMQLYGPDQDARTIQPDSLGGRLDITG